MPNFSNALFKCASKNLASARSKIASAKCVTNFITVPKAVRTSSLFVRTTMLLLVLALTPAFIIGFIQMQIVQSALEKDFGVVKSRLAERSAKSAVEFIKSVTGFLTTIGELDELSRFKKENYATVMRRVLESHPVIAELDIYDAKGKWVYGLERVPGSIAAEERPRELLSDQKAGRQRDRRVPAQHREPFGVIRKS
ncbi:MAG: hypothetical protein HY747_07345 [Elusimicrobia bacterium]|nr:hypothetical protein [Elusimicrobiota bacterium]